MKRLKLSKFILGMVIFSTIISGFFILGNDALAQVNPDTDTFGLSDFANEEGGLVLARGRIQVIVANIINVALGILGIIAIGIILYGGFLYMTSRGSEDQISRAKKVLINGLIGLAIILSAFAITQFIFRALSNATNSGVVPGGEQGEQDPRCLEPEFRDAHPEFCIPPEFITCEDQFFVVKSITPSTPGENIDPTDMNNTVIRAVFSRSIDENTDLDNALSLIIDDRRIPLTTTLIEDRKQVLEAVVNTQDFCHENQPCLEPGTYTITVNENIQSQESEERTSRPLDIDTNELCGSYPNIAMFEINTENQIDTLIPEIGDVKIDGNTGDRLIIHRGAAHRIETKIRDFVLDGNNEPKTSGSSYARLRVYEEGQNPEEGSILYDGPRIQNGSGVEFTFTNRYFIPREQEPRSHFIAEVTAYDIDHNEQTKTINFTVVGESNHCDEFGAPIEERFRDECLDPNAQCSENRDCPGSFQCIEGQCVGLPTILEVDPWDGAEGNWVTVLGQHFGQEEGVVEFGVDINQNEQFDDNDLWIPASLAQCRSNVWNDSWVIAEVPQQVGLAVDFNKVEENEEHGKDHGRLFHVDSLNTPDEITLEAWANPRIFEKLQSNIIRKTGSYGIFISSVDQKPWGRIHLDDNTTVVLPQEEATQTIDASKWNHIVLTADGNTLKLYVNGVLSVEKNYQGNIALTNNPIVVGSQNGSQGFFNGSLDEIRIYNRAITNNEVNSHFTGSFDNNDGLIAHWAFEETEGQEGTRIADSSGNNHTLEIRGPTVKIGKVAGVPGIGNIFSPGSRASIRITRASDSQQDTTTNDRGPRGTFEKNNTQRPGLCQVVAGNNPDQDFERNITQATPGSPVLAAGQGFGNGDNLDLKFGNVSAPISGRNNNIINSRVPDNLNPGTLGVKVTVGNEESNGIPFTISRIQDNGEIPQIINIDPQDPTPGSYITIIGERFGRDRGFVFLANNQDEAIRCANFEDGANCIELLPPEGCLTGSWGERQIIVEIPEGTSPQERYNIAVRTSSGIHSNGQDFLSVAEGEPLPSLCELRPNSGPAPRQTPVNLYGINIENDPTLFFFWVNADPEDVQGTWLSSRTDALQEEPIFEQQNNGLTRIETYLPIRDEEYSMSTGPIRVEANGKLSNSVNYNVNSCSTDGALPPDGLDRDVSAYHCCSEGRDTGLWKPNNLLCEGETRDAGYVWRFTTGKIANTLRVIEQCSVGGPLPSPTPWSNIQRRHGENACINAQIVTRFSLPLSPETVPPAQNTIKIYVCEQKNGKAECALNNENERTSQFDIDIETSGNQGVVKLTPKPDQNNERFLERNTWYRVTFDRGISSREFINILGTETERSTPLVPTRPINRTGIAYHFDFKTSEGICQITSAGIQPPSYEVSYLGVLQDSRYPFDDVLRNPANPLYYYVFGRGGQECRVINVDGLGWDWQTDNNDKALVELAVSERYRDSRVTVEAIENTFPGIVNISASTSTKPDTIEANSELTIHLGDPQVGYFEPNCSTSCVNAGIQVEFNRPMEVETYESGIKIMHCADANCIQGLVEVPSQNYEVSGDTLHLRVTLNSNLEPNTFYKVILNGEDIPDSQKIRALGRLNPPVSGRALGLFDWRFRTKDDPTACAVNRVELLPNPFTAREIGEQTTYEVVPYSTPNECSSRGQALNPWNHGWDWEIADEKVAIITNFDTGNGELKNYCTNSCLPRGSDVARSTNINSVALCGNGRIDFGEDCDIGRDGEITGLTCTLNCKRAGVTLDEQQDIDPNQAHCGNGIIDNPDDRDFLPDNIRGNGRRGGEQCDPGNTDGLINTDNPVCSEDCLLRGSPRIFNAQLDEAFCGDGFITPGESCDIGISTQGCSNNCLNTGTQTSAAWCQNVDNNEYTNTSACRQAVSVCGNAIVELGEECEIGVGPNPDLDLLLFPNGQQGVSSNNGSECNSRCLLQNICENVTVPNSLRCVGGTPGCNDDCTYAGSSLDYDTPSLCGDAVQGIGEVLLCEVEPNPNPRENIPGENPIQLVVARGNSLVVDSLDRQSTTITASIHDQGNLQSEAKYYLQCGYTEFENPIEVIEGPDVNLQFNGCPGNTNNGLGVGENSCCYPRPNRIAEYPQDTSGVDGAPEEIGEAICRNTFISVTFDGQIDEDTLFGNLIIASGHLEEDFNCSQTGEQDVTNQVKTTLLAQNNIVVDESNIWLRTWKKVKLFFSKVFGIEVNASIFSFNDINTWCSGSVLATPEIRYDIGEENVVTATNIDLRLNSLLDENTTYAVLLQGGTSGIKDIRGVGIINPDTNQSLNDSFIFETGTEICKIEHVEVLPSQKLFTVPNTSTLFVADVVSQNGQRISPIEGQYSWEWSWGPRNHPVFDIPAEGEDTNSPILEIASKNAQGSITSVAIARVVDDITREGNEVEEFSGSTQLTSLFCETPWPGNGEISFTDDFYNFSISYCSDSGRSGNKDDDLPFLRPLSARNIGRCSIAPFGECSINIDCAGENNVCNTFREVEVQLGRCSQTPDSCEVNEDCVGEENQCILNQSIQLRQPEVLPNDTQKRYLFFNPQNEDVIGLQVFPNFERLHPRDWYVERDVSDIAFLNINNFDNVTIAGYDAISDGNNYYVHALNIVDGVVYSNIYHFTINIGAQQSTKDVFETIIDSLEFNINLSDHQYCGVADPDVDVPDYEFVNTACTNDFECIALGSELIIQEEVLGTCQNNEPLNNNVTNCRFSIDCGQDTECIGYVEPVTEIRTAPDCKADKTEFLADWDQLHKIREIQTALIENQSYPVLAAGTFIPHYTNSRWPSWNQTLGQNLGTNLPFDNINDWTGCGLCAGTADFCTTDEECNNGVSCELNDVQTCWNAETTQFLCPVDSHIFEYEFDREFRDYTLHAPLDFFNENDSALDEFILDSERFTTDKFCTPEQPYSPFGERCGDGVVNPALGEQCDPVGKIRRGNIGSVPEQAGSCQFQSNRECSNGEADCDRYKETNINGKNSILIGSGIGGVCGFVDNESGLNIYTKRGGVIAGPQTVVPTVSCRTDNDCKNPRRYTSLSPLGIYIGDSVESVRNPSNPQTFQGATCLVEEIGGSTNSIQQCLGAINVGDPQVCSEFELIDAAWTCDSSCQWSYGTCQSYGRCGNGIVEGLEVCDSGTRNGQYGQCNTSCSGLEENRCGNGRIDTNNDQPLEFCDVADQTLISTGFCEYHPGDTCTTDEGCGLCQEGFCLGTLERVAEVEVCEEEQGICVNRVLNGGSCEDGYLARNWESQCSAPLVDLNFGNPPEAQCGVHGQFSVRLNNQVPVNNSVEIFSDKVGVCVVNSGNNQGIIYDATSLNSQRDRLYAFGCQVKADCQQLGTYLQRSISAGNSIVGMFDTRNRTQDIQNLLPPNPFSPVQSPQFFTISSGANDFERDRFRNFISSQNNGVTCAEIPQIENFARQGSEQVSCERVLSEGNCQYGDEQVISDICGLNGESTREANSRCTRDRCVIVSQNLPGQPCENSSECSGSCLANNTSAYHIDEQFSCAPTCQTSGGHCGDNITQSPYEQCDDGNLNNGDGCSQYCQEEIQETIPEEENQSIVGSCGDGVVQENGNNEGLREVCDLGQYNGIRCEPEYGESCRYCSARCDEILTVDPVEFCGDGIPNQDTIEQCDQSNSRLLGKACSENPEIFCSSGDDCPGFVEFCQLDFENVCKFGGQACTLGALNTCPRSVILNEENECITRQKSEGNCSINNNLCSSDNDCSGEQCIALQQPLVCADEGSYSCTNSCTSLNNTCVECTTIVSPQGAIPKIAIINPVSDMPLDDPWVNSAVIRLRRDDSSDFKFGDTRVSNLALSEVENIQEPFELIDVSFPPLFPENLESNNACNGKYVVEFVDPSQQRDPVRRISKEIYQFPYQVSGEPFLVSNEMVASPPLPPKTYRFVMRWGEEEGPEFAAALKVYNLALDEDARIVGHPTSDFSRELLLNTEEHPRFWWPSADDMGIYHYGPERTPWLYIHPEVALQKTFTQAITIDPSRGPQNNTYAIFVQGLNNTVGFYANTNLRVDMYEYRQDQDNEFGIYKPTRTFRIRPAKGTNPNPAARFWHVVNLRLNSDGDFVPQTIVERFGGQTRQNGSIETDFQDLLCNIPEEICDRI